MSLWMKKGNGEGMEAEPWQFQSLRAEDEDDIDLLDVELIDTDREPE